MQFLAQSIILFVSSILSFAFIFYKVSITNLQQIVVGVLIVLIILLDRFILKSKKVNFALRLILLFLLSLSLQALVLSTGGFYSPFLILFHLFAIALSFLVDLKVATVYLVMSIAILILATLFSDKLKAVLNNDYASVLLYLFSFMVIIPLSRFVAQRYHLKDALSKILSHQLKVQKDVFEALSDMVIITDATLKILSFNEAATRNLKLSPSELTDRPLFEVLLLKDINGNVIDDKYLSVREILNDKTVRIQKDLLMYIRNSSMPKKINIQIRPSVNLDGKVDQISLVISDVENQGKSSEIHQNIQEAIVKHKSALEEIYTTLRSKGLRDLDGKLVRYSKIEKDILLVLELQDHQLKPLIELKDISQLLSKIMAIEENLANALVVKLIYQIDNKYIDQAQKLIPAGSHFSPQMLTSAYFTIPIDTKWFDLLIQKILDMSIMLTSGSKDSKVNLFLTYDQSSVDINITVDTSRVIKGEERLLFTEYYGNLSTKTNLRLGSGLEGYMIKLIASLLGIPLDVKVNYPSNLIFSLNLSKAPQIQTQSAT